MNNNFSDYPQDPNAYLMHASAQSYRDGGSFSNSKVGQHLYKAKKWVNGKWRYIYDADAARNYHSAQRKYDANRKMANDSNMFKQAVGTAKMIGSNGSYNRARDAYSKSLVGKAEIGARNAYERFKADAGVRGRDLAYKAKKKGNAAKSAIKKRVKNW